MHEEQEFDHRMFLAKNEEVRSWLLSLLILNSLFVTSTIRAYLLCAN